MSMVVLTLSESFSGPDMASGSGRGTWQAGGSSYNTGVVYCSYTINDMKNILIDTTAMPTTSTTASSGQVTLHENHKFVINNGCQS